jgi:hypothetical protein
MIAPPYTPAFAQVFLPLLENPDVTGSLRNEEENDSVSLFIGKTMYYSTVSYIYSNICLHTGFICQHMCGCLGKPIRSRWASFCQSCEQKKHFSKWEHWWGLVMIRWSIISRPLTSLWSKISQILQLFLILICNFTQNCSYKKWPDHRHSTCCISDLNKDIVIVII